MFIIIGSVLLIRELFRFFVYMFFIIKERHSLGGHTYLSCF
jgi:hypothetical protein